MKVTAPNPRYNGKVGADTFINGTCANASPSQRHYYERAGYTILDDPNTPTSAPGKGEPTPGAKKAVWVEYAASMGIATGGLTRDQIIAAVHAAE